MYGIRLSEEKRREIVDGLIQQRVEGNTRAVRQWRAKAERTLLDVLAKELESRAAGRYEPSAAE